MAGLLTPCRSCGHKLWSELVFLLGAARFIYWYDDGETGVTYAEHVRVCPGCGVWLLGVPPDGRPHVSSWWGA